MTSPLHESRLLWIHDPHPNKPPRVTPRQTVIKENRDPVSRNNNQQTVTRNNHVENNNNARARVPLDIIPSASWFNSNLSPSSIPSPRSSVCNPVPRTNLQNNEGTTQVHNAANSSSLPPKRKRDCKHRGERRARERESKNEAFIHDARWPSRPIQFQYSSASDPVRPSGQRPHIVHADGSVPAS